MRHSADSYEFLRSRIGTPFYFYDGDGIASRCCNVRSTLGTFAGILYSVKANPNREIIRHICKHGFGCEVSSCGELLNTIAAGVNPRSILFVGPGKTPQAIELCVKHRVKAIVIESLDELELIDAAAISHDCIQPVALRINPDFVTAARLTMSGRSTQFGIDQSQLPDAITAILDKKQVALVGLHVYMGTRILNPSEIVSNTARILQLTSIIASQFQLELEFVDVGGGLGVPYYPNEKPLDFELLMHELAPLVAEFKRDFPTSEVLFELGRYLIAEFGQFITSVLTIKTSKGRQFAVCDGGTNCHFASGSLSSPFRRNFPIECVTAKESEGLDTYTLSGPLCTPMDLLADKVVLPLLAKGDLISVNMSGAYGPSFSPTAFLSFGWPAEVLSLNSSDLMLIRRHDSIDDLMRCQVFDYIR